MSYEATRQDKLQGVSFRLNLSYDETLKMLEVIDDYRKDSDKDISDTIDNFLDAQAEKTNDGNNIEAIAYNRYMAMSPAERNDRKIFSTPEREQASEQLVAKLNSPDIAQSNINIDTAIAYTRDQLAFAWRNNATTSEKVINEFDTSLTDLKQNKADINLDDVLTLRNENIANADAYQALSDSEKLYQEDLAKAWDTDPLYDLQTYSDLRVAEFDNRLKTYDNNPLVIALTNELYPEYKNKAEYAHIDDEVLYGSLAELSASNLDYFGRDNLETVIENIQDDFLEMANESKNIEASQADPDKNQTVNAIQHALEQRPVSKEEVEQIKAQLRQEAPSAVAVMSDYAINNHVNENLIERVDAYIANRDKDKVGLVISGGSDPQLAQTLANAGGLSYQKKDGNIEIANLRENEADTLSAYFKENGFNVAVERNQWADISTVEGKQINEVLLNQKPEDRPKALYALKDFINALPDGELKNNTTKDGYLKAYETTPLSLRNEVEILSKQALAPTIEAKAKNASEKDISLWTDKR